MPLEENNRYLVREQQAKNRRKSKGIIVVLILIILVLSSCIGYMYLENIVQGVLLGAVVTAVIVPLNFKLSKTAILAATKGKLIASDTDVDKHRSVLMQVEGLSISAGLHRVPDVYILPTATPNAFAGGMDEKSALGPVGCRGTGRRPSPRNGPCFEPRYSTKHGHNQLSQCYCCFRRNHFAREPTKLKEKQCRRLVSRYHDSRPGTFAFRPIHWTITSVECFP